MLPGFSRRLDKFAKTRAPAECRCSQSTALKAAGCGGSERFSAVVPRIHVLVSGKVLRVRENVYVRSSESRELCAKRDLQLLASVVLLNSRTGGREREWGERRSLIRFFFFSHNALPKSYLKKKHLPKLIQYFLRWQSKRNFFLAESTEGEVNETDSRRGKHVQLQSFNPKQFFNPRHQTNIFACIAPGTLTRCRYLLQR